jgi:hypothetical protein
VNVKAANLLFAIKLRAQLLGSNCISVSSGFQMIGMMIVFAAAKCTMLVLFLLFLLTSADASIMIIPNIVLELLFILNDDVSVCDRISRMLVLNMIVKTSLRFVSLLTQSTTKRLASDEILFIPDHLFLQTACDFGSNRTVCGDC